jgi:hypothetical protein
LRTDVEADPRDLLAGAPPEAPRSQIVGLCAGCCDWSIFAPSPALKSAMHRGEGLATRFGKCAPLAVRPERPDVADGVWSPSVGGPAPPGKATTAMRTSQWPPLRRESNKQGFPLRHPASSQKPMAGPCPMICHRRCPGSCGGRVQPRSASQKAGDHGEGPCPRGLRRINEQLIESKQWRRGWPQALGTGGTAISRGFWAREINEWICPRANPWLN